MTRFNYLILFAIASAAGCAATSNSVTSTGSQTQNHPVATNLDQDLQKTTTAPASAPIQSQHPSQPKATPASYATTPPKVTPPKVTPPKVTPPKVVIDIEQVASLRLTPQVTPLTLQEPMEAPIVDPLAPPTPQPSKLPEADNSKGEDGKGEDVKAGEDKAADDLKDRLGLEEISPNNAGSDLKFTSDERTGVQLRDVVASIHGAFPLLDAAYQENTIATGKRIAASGAFDTKLKGAAEAGPLGFYETYRNNIGVSQPLYGGADFYSGYRIGRGVFQPWYLERETNKGGEFKSGIRVPLLRDRAIDARRAELWRATYEQQRVQPEIRAMLIMFVRDGSIAYWKWIAAGQQYEIARRALRLAEERNDGIKLRLQKGDLGLPVLQDNLRAIAKRQGKVLALERKLRESAIKLSLYHRANDGQPLIPTFEQLSLFPNADEVLPDQLQAGVQTAVRTRPELTELDAQIRKVRVDLAEANNQMLPGVDVQVLGGQDVGEPTSSKRDKSEFELETGLYVDVPLQRRKARGKMLAAQGKLNQISAKRRFTVDKIRAEVQTAHAVMVAAYQRIQRAEESLQLAEYLAKVEVQRQQLGDTDLLAVVLREQYAIEAAEAVVDALLEYNIGQALFNAAIANDWAP